MKAEIIFFYIFLSCFCFFSDFSFGKTSKTSFEWKASPQATEYIVEIASDSEFKNVLLKEKTKEPKFVWKNVAAGKYFVHIAIIDSQGQQSVFSNTSVLNVKYSKPQIEKSSPQTHVVYQGPPPKQDFSWKEVPFSEKYEVEIYQEGKTEPLLKEKVNANTFNYDALKTGNYNWRVRAIDDMGNAGSWSEKKHFSLKKELTPPQLSEPLTKKEIKVDKDSYKGILFKWDAVIGATGYKFFLAKDENLKDIIEKKEVNENQFLYKVKDIGNYFWNVEAIDDENTPATTSPVFSFLFDYVPEREEIRLSSPAHQNTVYTSNPSTPLKFSWSALTMPVTYVIEIAEQNDFTETKIKTESQNASGESPFPDYGSYFWRVRTNSPVKPSPDLPPTLIKSDVFQIHIDKRKNYSFLLGFGSISHNIQQKSEFITTETPSGSLLGSSLGGLRIQINWWPPQSWWGLGFDYLSASNKAQFTSTDGTPNSTGVPIPEQNLGLSFKIKWQPQPSFKIHLSGSAKQISSPFLSFKSGNVEYQSTQQLHTGIGFEGKYSPDYSKYSFGLGYETTFSLSTPKASSNSMSLQFQYHLSQIWIGFENIQNNLTVSRTLLNPETEEKNKIVASNQSQVTLLTLGYGW